MSRYAQCDRCGATDDKISVYQCKFGYPYKDGAPREQSEERDLCTNCERYVKAITLKVFREVLKP